MVFHRSEEVHATFTFKELEEPDVRVYSDIVASVRVVFYVVLQSGDKMELNNNLYLDNSGSLRNKLELVELVLGAVSDVYVLALVWILSCWSVRSKRVNTQS